MAKLKLKSSLGKMDFLSGDIPLAGDVDSVKVRLLSVDRDTAQVAVVFRVGHTAPNGTFHPDLRFEPAQIALSKGSTGMFADAYTGHCLESDGQVRLEWKEVELFRMLHEVGAVTLAGANLWKVTVESELEG